MLENIQLWERERKGVNSKDIPSGKKMARVNKKRGEGKKREIDLDLHVITGEKKKKKAALNYLR